MTKIKTLHGTTKTHHSQTNVFKYTFLNIYIHMLIIYTYVYLMYICILTVYIHIFTVYIYILTVYICVYIYIFSKISILLFSHKSKEIVPFVRVWLNLEGVMHSETS